MSTAWTVLLMLGLLLVVANMSSCVSFGTAGTEFVGYLGGGAARNEGWLQVYVDGEWVTVCNHNWTAGLANTTCRLLGFQGVREDGWDVHLGAGSGPLRCLMASGEGGSVELTPCSDMTGDACTHSDDVGLKCAWEPGAEDFMNRLGYMFRLTGPAAGRGEGRVEVFLDDAWGTICGRGWSAYFADAVCKHLGYRGVAEAGWGLPAAAGGSGPVACADVFSLSVCQGGDEGESGTVACTHSHDVAIRCATEDEIGGGGNTDGRDMELVRMGIVAAGSALVAGGVFLPLLACFLLVSARGTRTSSEDLENLISSKEDGEVEEGRGAPAKQGLPAAEGEVNEGYIEVDEDHGEGRGSPRAHQAAKVDGAAAESDRGDSTYEDVVELCDRLGQGAEPTEAGTIGCKETNDGDDPHQAGDRLEATSAADDVTEEGQTTESHDDGREESTGLPQAAIPPVTGEIDPTEDDAGEGADRETVEPSVENFEFSMHGEHSLNSMYF